MNLLRTYTQLVKRGDRLRSDVAGSTVVLFALAFTMVMGAAAIAFDYTSIGWQRTKMQAIADAAALDAARELYLPQSSNTSVAAVAQNYAQSTLAGYPTLATAQVTANVIDNNSAVQVVIAIDAEPMLTRFFSASPTHIQTEAIARASGLPICLIGLDERAPDTIHLEANARLTAENCAVYSDSKSPQGIRSMHSAILKAGLICSAGGKVGGNSNFSPQPLTDCPIVTDPLVNRAAPPDSVCSATDKVVDGLTLSLSPGTYCNGLKVTGGARVTLRAGIYVIKDGPLIVDQASTFEGTNVGLYLKGDQATLLFDFDTTINLTAPKDGPLAGILLFEDRAASLLRQHKILSNNARILLGTIYIPNGRLVIDAHKPLADKSAYTIIVARRMELYSGPNLIMNTDYRSTDIPTPNGVGVVGGMAALVK